MGIDITKNKAKKGMYFSFDAVIALGIMLAALMAIIQIIDIQADDFDTQTREMHQTQEQSRDVLNAASAQEMSVLDESTQQELLQETVLEPDDMERTIIEGSTYLWAAGNRTHAAQVVDEFLEDKLTDQGLRVEVMEKGEEVRLEEGEALTIYETGEMPDQTEDIISSSTIVSGFELNETTEGYRSRARVLDATAQVAEVIPISPAGTLLSGPPGNTDFDVSQTIDITGDTVEEAQLDIAISDGPADGQRELFVDGEEVGFGEELYSEGDVTYYRNDLSDVIDEPGEYELIISLASHPQIEDGTRLYPGTRLEVETREEPEEIEPGTTTEEVNMKDILTDGEEDVGIFSVEDFNIPENAEDIEGELNLVADGFEEGCQDHGAGEEWDVRILLNGQEEYTNCVEDEDVLNEEITLENIQSGNNVLTIYANHDGEDEFWGGTETRIAANPNEPLNGEYSHIDIEYEEQTIFQAGSFRASLAEEIGEEGDAANPFEYTHDFEYSEIAETNIYLSQAMGEETQVQLDSGEGFEQIYSTEQFGEVPTLLALNPGDFETSTSNDLRIEDENQNAEILPYTLFESIIEAPTSVGYGGIFDTPEEAQEDAEERLEEQLGALIDAEEIEIDEEDDVETIGGQPRLWGPANIRVITWEDEE